jgi:diacylglycerol kinase (ATP)
VTNHHLGSTLQGLTMQLLPSYAPSKVSVADMFPICFLINTKSGGRTGLSLLMNLPKYSRCHVFDIADLWQLMEEEESLNVSKFIELISSLDNVRLVVGGGDGTVSFACAAMEYLHKKGNLKNIPPLAVLPLGVGNELSRCIGWSSSFSSGSLFRYCCDPPEERFIKNVREGSIIDLDIWNLEIEPPKHLEDTIIDMEGDNLRVEEKLGQFSLLCFFSIGFDANISHKFHLLREQFPGRTSSVAMNKFWYTWYGIKEIFGNTEPVSSFLELSVNGQVVPLPPGIKTLQILNIHSSADGVDFFGVNQRSNVNELQHFAFPSLNDGVLEVVGTDNVMHLMRIRMKMSHSRRIAQGNDIKIKIKRPLPAQLDGEAWIQMPSTIHITHSRKIPMVKGDGPTKGISQVSSD